MGARKKITADAKKEARKSLYFAKLNDVPTSPRKMRLLADLIRGMEVNKALGVCKWVILTVLQSATERVSLW